MIEHDLKILIAEDDEEDFIILKDIIGSSMGYGNKVIDRVASAGKALELLGRTEYDICLLDYRLGGMNGIELLQKVREAGFQIPVIFLTGQGDQEVAVTAMKTGATDYLDKAKVTGEALSQSINYSLGLAFKEKERREAQDELERVTRWMELILNSAGDGIFGIDRNGAITFINPAGSRLLGYASGDLVGKDVYEVLAHSDREGVAYSREECPILQTVFRGEENFGSEERFQRKNGSSFFVEYTSRPMREGKEIVGAVSTFSDITERLQDQETIRNLAFHDSLTGLPNRTLFFDRLNVALAHAERYKEKLAVLFIDLDDFKPVNDNLGHAMGDLLLKELAQRLCECLREGDTVGRFGGDEFVLILPQIGNVQDATNAGQKIIRSIASPFKLGGHSLSITASIGLALYPEHGKEGDLLLKSADEALYRAKSMGKNKIHAFEEERLASGE